MVPSIAVSARRLHDINKSGWLQLLGLIPLIGLIISPMQSSLSATKILIGLNAAVYLLVYVLMPGQENLWNLLPLYFPGNDLYRPWQFVTSLFMHANTGHLFFNMFALFSFGSLLERIWGAKRFVIFYLVVGLGAGFIYTAVNQIEFRSLRGNMMEAGFQSEQLDAVGEFSEPRSFALRLLQQNPAAFQNIEPETVMDLFMTYHIPVVGASGAIYGILTAFGLLFPNAKLSLLFLPVPIAAKYFIPALLLMDLFSGVTGFSLFGGGIAHFAHLGGALIGFLLMLLWKKELSGIDRTVQFS